MADGVVVIGEDGVVLYANPAAAALFGRDLVGQRFVYPVRDSEIAITGAGDGGLGEMRVAAGEWDGKPARVVVIRDVSERQTRAVLARRVARNNIRTTVAILASTVAHEVNNPAAVILANLAVMRDIASDFEAVFAEAKIPAELLEKYQIPQSLADLREMLADNQHGLDRIRGFLRELKGKTRDRTESPGAMDGGEEIDVNAAVAAACDLRGEQLPRGVSLVRDLAPVATITGDWLALIQLVSQLIDNAASAVARSARGSGVVEVITLCNLPAAARRWGKQARKASGRWVTIAVRDNGCGIAREHVERIFEPFFVVDDTEGRLGLGLSGARELAERLGGRIEVSSKLGKGSEFRLVLPEKSPRAHSRGRLSAAPGQVRARVLLIADDPGLAHRLSEMLEDSHDLVDAGSSGQALSHLARDSDYDLVLFDLASAMDAKKLHQALLSRQPRLASRLVYIGDPSTAAKKARLIDSTRAIVLQEPLSRALLREVIERTGG